MRIHFQNIFQSIAFISLIYHYGCNHSTDSNIKTEPQRGILYSDCLSISVNVGQERFAFIIGGKPPYSLKSNSDSSIVGAIVRGGLTVRGKAFGYSNIEVQDSLGYFTIVIPVTVADFVANPDPVTTRINDIQYTRLSGGIRPYSVSKLPDTAIANIAPLINELYSDQFYINGISLGTTSVEIKDASNPPKTISIPITVTNQFRLSIFGLSVYERQIDTFSVSGGTPPYGITHLDDGSIISALISGSVITVFGIKKGGTNLWLQDYSSPPQVTWLYIQVDSLRTSP